MKIFKRVSKPFLAFVSALLLLCGMSTSASAYSTTGLMFYFNFSDLPSAADGASLTDLSGNGRNGTVRGVGLTYNPATKALTFPGGPNGTGFLELAGDFSTFTNGVTIEFEGEFGTNLSEWERVFDFGIPGGEAEDFWVGHMADSNELALETWIGGINQGRCHTSTNGTALDNTRTFAKWLLTVDTTSGCRIYKNGVELPTQIKDGDYITDTPVQANGSTYPLPTVSNRTSNFVGRSNWNADGDFEGSMRYLRIYNRALTPEQVLDNATNNRPRTELASTGFDLSGFLATASLLVVSGMALRIRRRKVTKA